MGDVVGCVASPLHTFWGVAGGSTDDDGRDLGVVDEGRGGEVLRVWGVLVLCE